MGMASEWTRNGFEEVVAGGMSRLAGRDREEKGEEEDEEPAMGEDILKVCKGGGVDGGEREARLVE